MERKVERKRVCRRTVRRGARSTPRNLSFCPWLVLITRHKHLRTKPIVIGRVATAGLRRTANLLGNLRQHTTIQPTRQSSPIPRVLGRLGVRPKATLRESNDLIVGH